jgi:hypothetical protein
VGHLLSGAVGRLLVSSSVSRSWRMPWGSHWKTDPLWSSPELSVVHWGASMSRAEKIREICREPLVERHLRVCWENRAPTGNCSRCVKCMRTALVLLDEGVLDRYPGFARAPDLAANLDAMPTAPGRWKLFDALLEKGTLPPDVHRALGDLRRRTRRTRRGFLPWLDRFRERGTP